MNFTSPLFLFSFLPVFLILYFLMPNNRTKNIVLFLASMYFYSTGEPIFVYAMILSIVVNYFMAIEIHKSNNIRKRKLFLILDMIFNFSLLGIFKYTNFILSTLNSIFYLKFPLSDIPLPIGISFFTFQAASYVFDVYYDYGKDDANHYQKNIFSFALYISMFPQLIAGPIVRYKDIAQDLNNRKFDLLEVNQGLRRFIYGLSKKVLIANSMAIVADKAFSLDPKDAGFAMLILGAISFSMQIYFDFSGYSDMAIGLGKMLRFHFPENFDSPYLATSITDFWRRWHMTLSSWFKDYVYIPLGGSKKGLNKTYINLLIVWTLTGLWHGAKWTFVLWGLFYFVFLSLEKRFKVSHKNKPIERILPYMLCRAYTMITVTLLWVIFRSSSIRNAFIYIGNMFNISNRGFVNSQALFYIKEYWIFYLFAFLLSTNFFMNIKKIVFGKENEEAPAFIFIRNIYLALLLVVSCIYIIKGNYNPFIYFNF